jgi:hypothetical protein
MECVSVIEAKYVMDFKVWIKFNTGENGEIDLHDLIFSQKMAKTLRDPAAFSIFFLDSWPTLAWDCGFDIAPESLYERLKRADVNDNEAVQQHH